MHTQVQSAPKCTRVREKHVRSAAGQRIRARATERFTRPLCVISRLFYRTCNLALLTPCTHKGASGSGDQASGSLVFVRSIQRSVSRWSKYNRSRNRRSARGWALLSFKKRSFEKRGVSETNADKKIGRGPEKLVRICLLIIGNTFGIGWKCEPGLGVASRSRSGKSIDPYMCLTGYFFLASYAVRSSADVDGTGRQDDEMSLNDEKWDGVKRMNTHTHMHARIATKGKTKTKIAKREMHTRVADKVEGLVSLIENMWVEKKGRRERGRRRRKGNRKVAHGVEERRGEGGRKSDEVEMATESRMYNSNQNASPHQDITSAYPPSPSLPPP